MSRQFRIPIPAFHAAGLLIAIGTAPILAQQPVDGATAVGGIGTIMPNGIRSYGTSVYFPGNSGGIPVTIPTGPSVPYRGFPGRSIPGNSGTGIQGYGYGFGYAAGEGGGPAAVGGIGLPSDPGGLYSESAGAGVPGNFARSQPRRNSLPLPILGGGSARNAAPGSRNNYIPLPTPPTGNLPMFTPLRYQWPGATPGR